MKALKLLGLVLAALVVVLFGAYAWAVVVVNRKLARRYAVHRVTLQIPFPLSEPTAGRPPADSAARLATAAALERGRQPAQSRYVCSGRHAPPTAPRRSCRPRTFGR